MSQTEFAATLSAAMKLFFDGAIDDAAVAYESARALDPAQSEPWVGLGDVHVARGDLTKAAEAYDEALKRNPANYAVALNLARVLAMLENFGASYYVLDHAEKLRPNDPGWIKLRLEIARNRRDWEAMRTLASDLARVAPEDATGWRDLATAFFEQGLHRDAVTAFEQVLNIEGRTGESLAQYAALAIQALDFDRAQSALDEAEAIEPQHPRVLSTRALLLTYQGRTQEAEDYCRRCIAADPTFMSVYPQLSVLRKGRLEDDEQARLKDYVRREDIAAGARSSASFVLAHSYDAAGDYDVAFAEYDVANKLAVTRNESESLYYNDEGLGAWTDSIIDVFRQGASNEAGSSETGPQPIFIVGLPRSGSTLIETMLAAHSQVSDGGEMPMMPQIFNEWLKQNHQRSDAVLTEEERKALAERYMAGVPADIASRFTDKNLLNIESAGMIAQIFPRAKIINIRRNPVESALSIWRHDLPKFWAYANRFDDIAARYGHYARLVDHFERTLGERFTTVQYEDFADNFEPRARALIDWCGLDWEDACANPQTARDVAATLSAVQVRGAIARTPERAPSYARHLGPLRAALEAAGIDLQTGALKG
ncbi:MAG: sulfotransferase [Parvularculaceae bacterium]|nr:sulfotransferase [Parvularculaceae bacterium]